MVRSAPTSSSRTCLPASAFWPAPRPNRPASPPAPKRSVSLSGF